MALVRSELLQRSHAAAGANDGHEIAGLHLFVNKFLERAAHVIGTLKRETEIVNYNRDRPTNVAWFKPRGRHGRRVFVDRFRLCGPRRDCISLSHVVGKVRDLLLPAVFVNLDLFGLQIGDDLAVLVGDHSVNLDQIGRDLHDINVVRFLGC